MNTPLKTIEKTTPCSIYLSETHSTELVKSYVASTPETRGICNDPFISGIRYTRSLSYACAKILKALQNKKLITLSEDNTTVFNILRGGLNYNLRDSLHDAFGWNDHSSAFVSAQRARRSDNPEDWLITESEYKKIHLKRTNHIVFGDVVATGTSLEFALKRLKEAATKSAESTINSLIFFTIGSPCSHEILGRISSDLKSHYPNFQGASVIYIEGIFSVARPHTPITIKYTGTDLLRTSSTLAPEFIESQYENPSYPLERCTIYDAGSRAFDPDQYFVDVKDYWTKTLGLAEKGMTFEALLKERFPELDSKRFGSVDLKSVVKTHLAKIPNGANSIQAKSEH